MKKTTWTRKEVSEITGIPDRRVLFYTEQPFLLPGVKKNTGRGTARSYDIRDIFYLLVIKELSALGFSLTKIKNVLIIIRTAETERPSDMNISRLPELKLWENGQFTQNPNIVILSIEDDRKDRLGMGFADGEEDVHIKIDKPSQIILNLNRIFNKAKW